ncbi:hypothetical protein PITCH_A1710014 [uncultured Desulfobacterium sp.]|uniref:Glycosyltransferase n=1 Tax=uncultured Desulfobacterium sp. TaxID=201089 RepID=A0A445MUM4_9BACT|nr:hypothetical protein PITCH_A1710014 [uncultured Desulfobacterium sp.]
MGNAVIDKPKKIAVLLPSMNVGGAERLVLEELKYLKDDPRFSFEVHLVFEKGIFFNELCRLGINVNVWNAPHKSLRMLKVYLNIIMHLRRTGCELLHCHLLNSIGSLLGFFAGIPTITTAHGDIAFGYWERIGFKKSTLVLGCGEKVAQNISRFVKKSKIGILNNAIHCHPQKTIKKRTNIEQMGIPVNSVILLSLGRLTKQKGYDILIRAMQQVVVEVPEAVLLIGGDGDDKQQLQNLIKKLSLDKHIQLLGIVENTHELIESCDLYINCSRWEGLPITLLEAMSHAKPIIATKTGGNPDVIIDGKTGILVESEDEDSLVNAILELIHDSAMQKNLAMNAKTLFLAEYGIEKHCERLAEYYKRIV